MNLVGPKLRLLNTYRFLTDPYTTALAWRDRYGDPFVARTINGNVLMTGRAEHLKTIFAAPPDSFVPFGVAAAAPLVGERSVLILSGEAHRRDRKLLMPPFHGSRMRAYADTMHEVARRHLARAVDRDTTFQALAQSITLEIIVRAVFGVEEPDEVEAIGKGVLEVVDAVHPAFIFAPSLQREFGGFGPFARFRRIFEKSDADLQRLIEARRARGDGPDILGLLLAARYDDGTPMADSDIRDELRTLLVAGHETTAMTLAFLVDHLHRSPEALERARAEAEASPAQHPFIDAVAKETLRMRPIITEVIRTLTQPMQLGDIEVPVGMHVAASMVLAHSDPERFEAPNEFRPQRFLERSYGPFDYIPFGGGSRRCIGAAFADMEIRIVVAALLAEFDVTLLDPMPSRAVRRNLTMGPKNGVPIHLTQARRARGAHQSRARYAGSHDSPEPG